MSFLQCIESTFTASSARCPSQPPWPHVVYSSTVEPANPKDRLHGLLVAPVPEWSLDPRCCRDKHNVCSRFIIPRLSRLFVFLLDLSALSNPPHCIVLLHLLLLFFVDSGAID